MKSDATYAGDPRHQASEVMKLRAQVTLLLEENRRLRAEAKPDDYALTEFAAALRRRQRVDL